MRFVGLVLFVLAVWGSMAARPLLAAGNASAAKGLIADKCTSCHRVPGYEARWERAEVNAPPFERIAKNPDAYPPRRLRAFLQKPHWPMSQFILSVSDIDNILAFIEELR